MNVLTKVFGAKELITKPEFIKEFNKEGNTQLKDLEELLKIAPKEKIDFIKRDINFLKQGLEGEGRVAFELKNSFVPFLAFHDIRIEHDELVSQMDFLLISKKYIAVIEVKNYNGNLKVDKDGGFKRIITDSTGKTVKVNSIYSPIVQNDRHVKILEKALKNAGIKINVPIIPITLIANPSCDLSVDYYQRKKVMRYEYITNYLNELEKKYPESQNEKSMRKIADFISKADTPIRFNNVAKYSINKEVSVKEEKPVIKEDNISINEKLVKALKFYRFKKATEKSVKAYEIFTNKQMEEIISKNPKNFSELAKIEGFSYEKVGDLGLEIINILKSAN